MTEPRFCIVSAAYNVAEYLPEFFNSLEQQTIGFDRLHVVLVDDGSSDNTAELIEQWAQGKDNVSWFSQPNAGQAAARNAGLPRARGDWLTFTDPDDVLKPNYFAEVDEFLGRHPDASFAMLSTRMHKWDETTGEERKHPLDSKFSEGDEAFRIAALEDYIQLSAASAIFHRQRILDRRLKFDPLVKPTFEDGKFVAQYLLRSPREEFLGVVPAAEYLYRVRASENSTVQRSMADPAMFTDRLEHGFLSVLREAAESGPIPHWLQRTVLYDLQWMFNADAKVVAQTATLPEPVLERFHDLMGQIMPYIEPELIHSYHLGKPKWTTRAALASYHPTAELSQNVQISYYDLTRSRLTVGIAFRGQEPPDTSFTIDEEPIGPTDDRIRGHQYFGRVLFGEHLRTFDAFRYGELRCFVDGQERAGSLNGIYQPFPIRRAAWKWQLRAGRGPEWEELSGAERLALKVQRKRALSSVARRRFADAWVLMDRFDKADDSGEHLYRWLRENHPELNLWFMIDKGTADYSRLKADGFNVVDAQSPKRAQLMINAKFLISSHADLPAMYPFPLEAFGDLTRYRFVFLQHGVLEKDASRWLNTKEMHMLNTSARAEYEAIVGDWTNYKFTADVVKLCGLPRHDSLLAKAEQAGPPTSVTVMPTWRSRLSKLVTAGVDPDALRQDPYFRNWRELLNSVPLRRAAERSGAPIRLVAHWNMAQAISAFEVGEHVHVAKPQDIDYQSVLVDTALLITDYSSLASEAGLLRRPVIYFQFDPDEVAAGHIWRKGFFDYQRDGFGPVVDDPASAADAVAQFADRGFDNLPEYARRSEEFFTFRDGRNSERVYEAILSLG